MVKERLAAAFPFLLAAILPLVGIVLAAVRFARGDTHEGVFLLVASALGATLAALILSSV